MRAPTSGKIHFENFEKLISEKLDTSSSLYFLLAGVDMTDIEKIARKAFNEIDQDKNGTITFEEFADSDWALNL